MKEGLPPPHWSPTGNSGAWYWGDECWKWADDEQIPAHPPTSKKKNWLKKIKNKIWKTK